MTSCFGDELFESSLTSKEHNLDMSLRDSEPPGIQALLLGLGLSPGITFCYYCPLSKALPARISPHAMVKLEDTESLCTVYINSLQLLHKLGSPEQQQQNVVLQLSSSSGGLKSKVSVTVRMAPPEGVEGEACPRLCPNLWILPGNVECHLFMSTTLIQSIFT